MEQTPEEQKALQPMHSPLPITMGGGWLFQGENASLYCQLGTKICLFLANTVSF